MVTAAYHREYYQRTKETRLRLKKANREKYLLSTHAFLRQYCEDNPCVDCGESDYVVLEFDHLRDKTLAISDMVRRRYSLSNILKEIEKCVVRCSNCHKRKTAIEQGWYGAVLESKDS